MRARQENLRAPRLAADVHDQRAKPVAGAVVLARQLLIATQHRLGAAEIDDHMAVFDALDDAVDDLADAVLVVGELTVALGVADLLCDDLLGRHRGDAAEIDRRQRLGDEGADFGLGIFRLRFLQRDLRRVVLDRLDDFEKPPQPHFAGRRVDLRLDQRFVPVARARGAPERVLHRFDDERPVD